MRTYRVEGCAIQQTAQNQGQQICCISADNADYIVLLQTHGLEVLRQTNTKTNRFAIGECGALGIGQLDLIKNNNN